jgi:hypothetical protein
MTDHRWYRQVREHGAILADLAQAAARHQEAEGEAAAVQCSQMFGRVASERDAAEAEAAQLRAEAAALRAELAEARLVARSLACSFGGGLCGHTFEPTRKLIASWPSPVQAPSQEAQP